MRNAHYSYVLKETWPFIALTAAISAAALPLGTRVLGLFTPSYHNISSTDAARISSTGVAVVGGAWLFLLLSANAAAHAYANYRDIERIETISTICLIASAPCVSPAVMGSLGFMALITLSSLIGQVVLEAAKTDIPMSLTQSVTAATVGSGLLLSPFFLYKLCTASKKCYEAFSCDEENGGTVSSTPLLSSFGAHGLNSFQQI